MRCWYTRWKMSNAIDADDAGADGGAAALAALAGRGHAARCTRCQAYARSLAALHGRLERGALAPDIPAPAPLAPARPARWPLLAAGAAVAAAGVALALRAGGPATTPTPPAPTTAVNTPPTPAPVPAPALQAGSLQRTAARVSHIFTEAPLETELRALLADGARGVGAVLASSGLRERL